MRVCNLVLFAAAAMACNCRKSGTEERFKASAGVAVVVQHHRDAAVAVGSRPTERPRDGGTFVVDEDCSAFLAGMRMREASSPEDDRLTSPVREHMERANLPFPKNARFLITVEDSYWKVRVVDIAALCGGRRPRFDTYHVGVKRGKMQILYAVVGM